MTESRDRLRIMDRLYRLAYPSIFFYANPLKIYEYRALVRLAGLKKDHVVLDLGCGGGKQTCCLGEKAARVVGLDPDENCIAAARQTLKKAEARLPVEFLCGTLESATLADKSFDRILSFSVIEHIPDSANVFMACHRKLKPGGRLVFSTDNIPACFDAETAARHKRAHRVAKYFTPSELRQTLAELGFHDVTVSPILRTHFARRLFFEGMETDFRFRWSTSLASYAVLKWCEAFDQRREEGLFLIASATKS